MPPRDGCLPSGSVNKIYIFLNNFFCFFLVFFWGGGGGERGGGVIDHDENLCIHCVFMLYCLYVQSDSVFPPSPPNISAILHTDSLYP